MRAVRSAHTIVWGRRNLDTLIETRGGLDAIRWHAVEGGQDHKPRWRAAAALLFPARKTLHPALTTHASCARDTWERRGYTTICIKIGVWCA